MKDLEYYLSTYAKYHRDQRNILTHYVGIPLIVYAVFCLLSRPIFIFELPSLGAMAVTPALVVWLATNLFYIKLDVKLGAIMTLLTGVLLWLAQPVAQLSTGWWLTASIGIFVGGWVLQFIGHYYEGKKPAFVDDIMGLVIGPLFVVTEFGFELGLRQDLKLKIEQHCGPVH